MNVKNYTGIVPQQKTGKVIDTQDAVECAGEQEAKTLYRQAKERLLNVNQWHEIAGQLSAAFQLVNKQGEEVNRPVQQGDFFKIDVLGPGPQSGDGYDWVCVEALEEYAQDDVESTGIRVRPASDPQNADPHIAHFYDVESTSNFIVTREGKTVTASVYDRNTKPNEDAGNTLDKIRDAAVGLGAVTMLSKLQWQALVDGLLAKDEEKA